jgi:hypothetical protein
MTLPLSVGFPDWNRSASEAQFLEINDISVTHNATFTYPIRYVGNAQTFELWFACNDQRTQVTITFWADGVGTVSMDIYSIMTAPFTTATATIPVISPFISVDVAPSVGGNFTYTLQLWRNPHGGAFAGGFGNLAMFSQNNTPIGGGVNSTLTYPRIREGEASWCGGMTGGNWAMVVFATDSLGNVTIIDFVDQTASPFATRRCWLPPAPISIQISNFAAGAQTYRLFMTRKWNE